MLVAQIPEEPVPGALELDLPQLMAESVLDTPYFSHARLVVGPARLLGLSRWALGLVALWSLLRPPHDARYLWPLLYVACHCVFVRTDSPVYEQFLRAMTLVMLEHVPRASAQFLVAYAVLAFWSPEYVCIVLDFLGVLCRPRGSLVNVLGLGMVPVAVYTPYGRAYCAWLYGLVQILEYWARPVARKVGRVPGTCCICLEEFREENLRLHCGHTLHLECAEKWPETCPICRAVIYRPPPWPCLWPEVASGLRILGSSMTPGRAAGRGR